MQGRTVQEQAAWREEILAAPERILEDREVMAALLAAEAPEAPTVSGRIIDLRGVAMERLERRLDRLEDTHRAVLAAAYENLAGVQQVHRAALALLEAARFEEFLGALAGEVTAILRIDAATLLLESDDETEAAALEARIGPVLAVRAPGFIARYFGEEGVPDHTREIVLRSAPPRAREVHGVQPASEALIRLDFGPGRQEGALAFAAADAHHFQPGQGTDLLAFLGGVFERQMRRFLG
jgi:uncharacterized protein YigA (DUF484 family)